MFIEKTNDGVKIYIRLSPKAKREGIEGVYQSPDNKQRLKIAVNAPPVDGKANQELIKQLSKTIGFSKTSIQLVAGQTDRNKTLFIKGNPEDLYNTLLQELSKWLTS